MIETLDSSALEEVKQIEEALARVDSGTYGVCLRFGHLRQLCVSIELGGSIAPLLFQGGTTTRGRCGCRA